MNNNIIKYIYNTVIAIGVFLFAFINIVFWSKDLTRIIYQQYIPFNSFLKIIFYNAFYIYICLILIILLGFFKKLKVNKLLLYFILFTILSYSALIFMEITEN